MRQRMQQHHSRTSKPGFDLKHGRGGLIDIEFLCQYLVLRFAQQNPALTKYRSNLEIISELETSGKIPGEDAETLSRTLRLYLAKDNELKLGRRQAHLPAQAFRPEREAVSKLWQQYLESNSP